jgi:hypothetical protein
MESFVLVVKFLMCFHLHHWHSTDRNLGINITVTHCEYTDCWCESGLIGIHVRFTSGEDYGSCGDNVCFSRRQRRRKSAYNTLPTCSVENSNLRCFKVEMRILVAWHKLGGFWLFFLCFIATRQRLSAWNKYLGWQNINCCQITCTVQREITTWRLQNLFKFSTLIVIRSQLLKPYSWNFAWLSLFVVYLKTLFQ